MSTPKSKRGRKRKTAKGDDPSEINRSFSQQARDRFTVLFEETMRHLDGLSLTFTATSGAGIVPVSTIKSEFERVFRERMDKLVHDIEEQENTTRDGNFGQNPKEKWGVFQEDVDGMVGCMYEFIEWASGSMTKDPLGRMYIIAELLDGIFGAVWSSKQGLKHVWNKGILDKKQDFFCLAKILDHFPLLAEFCDDVARNRLGPDRNTSWTEVVQDLRNIRLRTVAAFVNREYTGHVTPDFDANASRISLESNPPHSPANGELVSSISPPHGPSSTKEEIGDMCKDFSMEDLAAAMDGMNESGQTQELAFAQSFERPMPHEASFANPSMTSMQPMVSFTIPQQLPDMSQLCSGKTMISHELGMNEPFGFAQTRVAYDNSALHAMVNDPVDYDFEMDDYDDGGNCIFDIDASMPTLLNSMEEMQLANLAVNGKISNGSL